MTKDYPTHWIVKKSLRFPTPNMFDFVGTNIFWNTGRWLQIWIIYSLPRSTQAGIISTYSLPIWLAFTTPRRAGRTTNSGTVIVSKKILKEHSVKFLIFYKKIGLHLSTMHYFLTSNWDFSANINEQELDGFYDVGVFYSITTFNSIKSFVLWFLFFVLQIFVNSFSYSSSIQMLYYLFRPLS